MNEVDRERFWQAQREDRWEVVGTVDLLSVGRLFAYTSGLTQFERPELMMVEFLPEVSAFVRNVLNGMGAQSLDEPLVDERIYRIGFGDLRVVARSVDPFDPRFPLLSATGQWGSRVRAVLLEPVTSEAYFPQGYE